MTHDLRDLDRARAEVTASSAGGVPFLFAFALTLSLTGLASLWLPVRTVAYITLFQGNVALPLAFWLERRMAHSRMSDTNPLKSLSVYLAMSQVFALPVVIMLLPFAPAAVPAGMAAIGAAHFLPYVWLQRTRWYLGLAIAVGLVPAILTALLKHQAAPYTLFFMAAAYVVVGLGVRARANALRLSDAQGGV